MKRRSTLIAVSAAAAVALAVVLASVARAPHEEGPGGENGGALSSAAEAKLAELGDGEDGAVILGTGGVWNAEKLGAYLETGVRDLTSEEIVLADLPLMARRVLESGRTELFLVLSLNDLLPGSAPAPDRRERDVEKIGDPERYALDHAAEFTELSGETDLEGADALLDAVRGVRDECAGAGARFTLILSPVWEGRMDGVEGETLRALFTALSEITDFWDFTLTSVSGDIRYFYDGLRARPAVMDMVLGQIFGDGEVYRPEDFGFYVTADNAAAYISGLDAQAPAARPEAYTVDVPILMYHHFEESPEDPSHVSPETFRMHLEALRDNGYTPVSVAELAAYVYRGAELPEKPVCITMDDGYASNYELAYPLLREFGMKATIFAIGVSVGHEKYYKDTQFLLTPHFGFDEAREMTESGLVSLESHTWDMHQWAPFETGDRIRENILPFEGESEEEYRAVLERDLAIWDEALSRELGREGFTALAYPSGRYNSLSEEIVHAHGIPVTLSTRTDTRNVLVRGLPQSLYALCRWGIDDNTTAERLLSILEG